MHSGARSSVDRKRVDAAARRTIARPAPPVEPSASAASGSAVASSSPARDDELGATLARAVAQRAPGESATGGHSGAPLQRILGFGKKKKKPARPTQALPAPPRPKQGLPAPARPTQPLPPSAAASPSIFIPGAIPQAMLDLGAGKFDLGSKMDPFEARQFNLDSDPFEEREFNLDTPAAVPAPAMQAPAPDAAAPVDDGYAPDLAALADENGMVTVAGDPYLESLVSSFASDRGNMAPRSYGALRNLQVIATLRGAPPPRPIERRFLATSSTAYDWGYAY
jgi:hypothetical protein